MNNIENELAFLDATNYKGYVADTGTANAYVLTLSPAITSYVAGQVITFKATYANTGACTINVNGVGLKPITRNVLSNLVVGDIVAGQLVTICYDGSYFQLISIKPVGVTMQKFITSGTFTAPYAGVYKVTCTGGGGSGGYDSATSGGGAGGAGGGTSIKYAALTNGQVVTVTVGAGGVIVSTTHAGYAGSTSSFGALCSATGGGGGNISTSTNYVPYGSSPGVGSGGDINLTGNYGQGVTLDYNSGTVNTLGGASFWGGGTSYGAGGMGGGIASSYQTAGNAGIVFVEWVG